jgi:hypothetical protein
MELQLPYRSSRCLRPAETVPGNHITATFVNARMIFLHGDCRHFAVLAFQRIRKDDLMMRDFCYSDCVIANFRGSRRFHNRRLHCRRSPIIPEASKDSWRAKISLLLFNISMRPFDNGTFAFSLSLLLLVASARCNESRPSGTFYCSNLVRNPTHFDLISSSISVCAYGRTVRRTTNSANFRSRVFDR